MSITAYKAVWSHSSQTGSAKILMLALAEYADDSGRCWPSIGTLAEMVGVNERNIKRLITQCEATSELIVDRGAGRGNVSIYTITLCQKGVKSSQKGVVSDALSDSEKGVIPDTKGVKSSQKGVIPDIKGVTGDTRSVNDPPIEPLNDPSEDPPTPRTPSASEAFPFKPARNNPDPTPAEERVRAIAEVCGLDLGIPRHRNRCENAAAQLAAYTAEYIRERYASPGGYWRVTDFRGRRGDRPTPEWVIDTIALTQNEPSVNGHAPPGDLPNAVKAAASYAEKRKAFLGGET